MVPYKKMVNLKFYKVEFLFEINIDHAKQTISFPLLNPENSIFKLFNSHALSYCLYKRDDNVRSKIIKVITVN